MRVRLYADMREAGGAVMSYSYMISGTINAHPIKAKAFKNYESALKYLDKLVTSADVQIEEIYTTEDLLTTYVANNYSRFTLAKIA